MNIRLLAGALVAWVGVQVGALGADSFTFLNYSGCVKLTQTNPNKALSEARDWLDTGGGAAASHCMALALSSLRQYAKAAAVFEDLAKRDDIGGFRAQAPLWDQAGNAWLLAGDAKNAERAFGAGLALTPNDIDLRTDRARARAKRQDWFGTEADLSAALLIDQKRVDLLVLRASARRAMGHKTDAAVDILRALTLKPGNPGALVERGSMKYEVGDWYGARKDWGNAAKGKGADAADAAAARALLQKMGPAPKPLTAR